MLEPVQSYTPAVAPTLRRYSALQITHILRDLLHGWGTILFCVNVSPAAPDYDTTAGVLQYAAMATHIGNAARAEAPKRVKKAISPNITKKRKIVLPKDGCVLASRALLF